MKTYINIYLALMLAVLSLSCERNLEIPLPEHQSRLVLNSILLEGKTPILNITRSFGTLETVSDSALIVPDATVELWSGGIKLTELSFSDTTIIDTVFFEGSSSRDFSEEKIRVRAYFPPSSFSNLTPNQEYEFRASHPTYGNATAKATLMPKPEILDISIVKDSVVRRDLDDGYLNKWTAFKIRVQDPAPFLNAYDLQALIRYTYKDSPQDTGYATTIAYTDFTQSIDGIFYGEQEMIKDDDFNGNVHTLIFYVTLPFCCGYPEFGDTDDSNIEFIHADLTLFMAESRFANYWKKQVLQSENRSDGIEGILIQVESVQVQGNVEGGYGLVSSYNYGKTTVEFP
ncbi:MAG: DUF4249 family protein [Bacteroidota bacterium]